MGSHADYQDMAPPSARPLQALLNVHEMILAELDPQLVLRRIAAEALTTMPKADGAAIVLVATDAPLAYVAGAGTGEGLTGEPSDKTSLIGYALRLGAVLRSNDVERDHRLDPKSCRDQGVRSTIAAPLSYSGGVAGAIELTSSEANAFSDADILLLQQLSNFMGSVMASTETTYRSTAATLGSPALLPRSQDNDEKDIAVLAKCTDFVARSLGVHVDEYRELAEARARIRRMFREGGPSTVVQPIFDLKAQRPVGFEALARFNSGPTRSPHLWFQEASAVGLGIELEAATLRSALQTLDQLPKDTYLSINLSPEGAITEAIVSMLEDAPPRRLVIEVTEHTVVQDYDQLNESLRLARDRGTRVAVDDAGAGYASMRHILKLKPDCIKLDIGITSGIDTDPVRKALAASLISFAHEIDATLVAEGIETRAEMETLRALGVSYGQGYFLGRPAPATRNRPRRLSHTPSRPASLPATSKELRN
jgi:EAL domain-containing protein (putative c-di-GMP-specific phosphodiesterase class I)